MVTTTRIRFLLFLAFILLGLVCIFTVAHNTSLIDPLKTLQPSSLAGLFGIKALVLITNGLKLFMSIKVFGRLISLRTALGLSSMTSMGAYFMPARISTVGKALYLKANADFPLAAQAPMYILAGLLEVIILMTAAVIILLLIPEAVGSLAQYRIHLALALPTTLLLLWLVVSARKVRPSQFPEFFEKAAGNITSGLISFFGNPRASILFLGALSLSILAKALALTWCFLAIGATVNFGLILVVLCAVQMSSLIQITPGNIGVTESLLIAGFILANVDPPTATSVAILSRSASIFTQFTLGSVLASNLVKASQH